MIVGIGVVIGQNIEVRLESGIGISPASINSASDWIESEQHSNLIPIGLAANYFFLPDNPINFFLGTGVKYLNNNYSHNVKSLEYGYNLESIAF